MKKRLLFICLLLVSVKSLNAQSIYLPEGSVIIDMGVVPQTIENGLKPYGLVYSLITNYSTPVIWSINQSKSKDGVDFIVDNKEFRGGTFAIRSQFLTDAVLNEISVWESQGVVTYESLSAAIIPFYRELKFFPNWVFDTNNGGIAEGYLENAGIPVELASREALPTELTTCDDLFILPHADPTWEDHGEALLNWNSPYGSGPDNANGGYIWSGCHAVSALENLYNPNNLSEQTNFLSLKIEDAIDNGDDYYENALSLWGEHNGASEITPYQIDFPTDPFMQFVGSTDGAHAGGSEQIYLPVLNGGWRASTKVSVWDANHEDLGLLSNGKAALIAYGYAFGDTNRGQVMYEAGHELSNGTDEENVAAQRAFLNFSFEAAKAKVPSLVVNSTVPELIEGGDVINFDVFANTNNGTDITYEWSSSNSLGTFNDSTSATPIFSTSSVELPELCVVTVKVSDGCGRITFNSWGFEIVPQPTAPVATNDSYATYNTGSVSFNALANDTDLNNNLDVSSFEVLSPLSVLGGTFVNNGNGNITFNPDANFSGIATLDYQICDDTSNEDGGPFCETATITVHVAESSCDSSETISNETSYALEVLSSNKWKNEDDALDFPDSKYSKSDDSEEGFVIYDLGDIAYVGSYITIRYTTDIGELVNGVIDVASSASGFPNKPNSVSSTLEDPNYEFLFIPVQEIGLRYVKITGDKGFAIESIQFEKEICVEPSQELIAPTVNNLATEDTTPIITGTWGGNSGGDDSLTVNIDGNTYSENNGLTTDGTNWSLNLESPIDYGIYNVMAVVIRNSSNEMIMDSSSNELYVMPSQNYQQSEPVSSGNDGGLESNGNLASLIAKRNFTRIKSQNVANKKSLQAPFIKVASMYERSATSVSLEDFIPETGLYGTEIAHISSPEDLIAITNAQQIFSVDYYLDENRIAAVLATETSGTIYDHSKIICDRLNSSDLEDAFAFSMQGHQIISTRLKRANGEIEYTLSFSIRLNEESFELFSFWNIDQYPQGDFYNFQIWGNSYSEIFSICSSILDTLSAHKPLVSTTVDNVVPLVFVKSGYYSNGAVHLNVVNKVGATSMTFEGNIAATEVSERFNMIEEIELNGEWNQTIAIETGHLFDIGLSLTTDGSDQNDALYLADGPWGIDYLQEYATVDVFLVNNESVEQIDNEYQVERQPSVSGTVKGNVNLFRHLLPGDQTLDVTEYNELQFSVKNNQPIEIILMEENLSDWNNRLRYTIPANSNETQYNITFSEFSDGNGNTRSIDNVKTLVFSVISDYSVYIPYTIELTSLSFRNNTTLDVRDFMKEEKEVSNYPNPFASATKIMLPESSNYADIEVLDITGRIVDSKRMYTDANGQELNYYNDQLSTGIYKYLLKAADDRFYFGTFLIK